MGISVVVDVTCASVVVDAVVPDVVLDAMVELMLVSVVVIPESVVALTD